MADPTIPDALIVTIGGVLTVAINAAVWLLVQLRRTVHSNRDKINDVQSKVDGSTDAMLDLLRSTRDHMLDGTPLNPREIRTLITLVGPPPPSSPLNQSVRALIGKTPPPLPGQHFGPPEPSTPAAPTTVIGPVDAQPADSTLDVPPGTPTTP